MIRKKRFWIILSVVAALIVLAGAAAVLYTPISSKYLTGQISAKLSEAVGGNVSIDKATVRLVREIQLKNVRIEKKDEATVTVDNLSVNYRFLPILRKRLIGRCNLYGVDVLLKGKSAEGFELVSGTFGWNKESPIHFSRVSCDLWAEVDTVATKDLYAEGTELKITGEGTITEGKGLNCRYQVYFRKAEEVVPEGLRPLFIRDKESGWLGLNISL